MRQFCDEDFILHTEAARRLYHDHAERMPILDYHSHLPPREVAEDQRFANIASVWLGGDHYKWRAMRSNGVPEDLVTGRGSDRDKFFAWARTVPKTVGNPLYHWTHLELRRYFGVETILDEDSAPEVWERCNAVIAGDDFSPRSLLRRMNVRALCTTDDPADDLASHAAYAAAGAKGCVMVPTFRPDKALAVEDPAAWGAYIRRLEAASGVRITRYPEIIAALDRRHAVFHALGCRLSDHALERPFAVPIADAALDAAVAKLNAGEVLPEGEALGLKTAILLAVGRMNAARGWTMQLHIGAMRNLNSRMFAQLGPDTGYDAINDEPIGRPLARLLDMLARDGELPSTILYTLNPAWNDVIGTIVGCFQDGSKPGKIQFGSAWWFNDQLDGMTRQMTALANLGLLSRFVGMLTDSRSFLSFPRHEYFRRLLCDIIGGWVERGEAPADFDLLGGMVRDICFRNAYRTFGIPGVNGE